MRVFADLYPHCKRNRYICSKMIGSMYKRTVDNWWSFKTADTKEYTHCYHTYPAMMIPQVARALLDKFKPKDGIKLLFDPYMGSGTSLVEANISGVNAIGTDLNPLARMMAKVKTTHYNEKLIKEYFSYIQSQLVFYNESLVKDRDFSRISNYFFWYNQEDLLKLSYLSQLIKECDNYQEFFNLILSEVVREVSFTRNSEFKRYKMSENQLKKFCPDTFRLFETKAIRNIKGLIQFNGIPNSGKSQIYDFNSVNGIPSNIIEEETVDMVITSPPYGDSHTTVAYGQFSRWSNEWFGFNDAKHLDNILMGGKKYKNESFQTNSISSELEQIKQIDPKRYQEVASFLSDYYHSIANVAKCIRHGGVVCYVVGNRTVKTIQIPLDYFTVETFSKFGFKHIDTIVREIPNKRMPLKNSPTNEHGKTINTMNNEYIVILQKD